MKKKLLHLILAALLPVIFQTASAQTNVLLTDNFTVSANSNDPNFDIGTGRQGGANAISLYTAFNGLFGDTGDQHQVGNTGTDVGQPGGSANSNILLLYQGATYNNIDVAAVTNAIGPVTISFDMYTSGNPNGASPDHWGAFSLTTSQPTPLGDNGGFGFLQQISGGLTLFQNNGNNITPGGWGNAGFATDPHWSLTFTDTSGTGSAFNGHGSKVRMVNGTTTLGTVTLTQLNSANVHPGFCTFGSMVVGIDNLSISATPTPSVIPPTFASDVSPLRSEVTTGAPWTLSVTVNGTTPQYQWFNQSGPVSNATNTSYTFNAVAGTNSYYVTVSNTAGSIISSTAVVISAANFVTVSNFSFENDVAPSGGNVTTDPMSWTSFNKAGGSDIGSGHAGGSDYTVNNPLAATADANQYCYVNIFNGNPTGGIYQDVGALRPNSIYTLTVAIGHRADPGPGGNWSPGIISLVNGTNNTGTVLATGGGLPSTPDTWQDYTITCATGGSVSGDLAIVLSVVGASSIQADFDNVRLTSVVSPVPLPSLITNTTPASATVSAGSNAVFTAAYSNSPPVTLQWQQIVSGSPNVTNNINTGVVTVTNNGVVSSTLTLNNVQLTNAGSYQLKTVNATNVVTIVYSQAAPLTVVPPITWYAAGTYNYAFSNDTVLALAGTPANEAYGVGFGGGSLVTDNNYTFDDYNSGSTNLTIAAGGLNNFSGYLGSASTGDLNFDTVLNNGVHGSSANTATLNNLTIGQTYTVLVLLSDTRGAGAGGTTFHVTDGINVSPNQRYAYANGVPNVGGYIMGTFTALSTNQPLTVLLNNGNSQYNAILLEKGLAAAPQNAPVIATDINPLVQRVTSGAPVTLTAVAVGSSPLKYQWFNQSGAISGATNSSYTFNALNGTNSYYLSITNTYGSAVSSTGVVISSPAIVTVKNFSFEFDAAAGAGALISSTPTSWTAYNRAGANDIGSQSAGGVDYSVFTPLAPTADQNQYCYVNMFNPSVTGGIYQDVGALKPNTTYSLTVAIGSRADRINSPGIISLINGTDNTGAVLATTNGIPATQDTWQDYSATFTTGGSVSGDLTIALSVLGNGATIQADFDNVRLATAQVFHLGAPMVSGSNLILSGSGGSAGAPYTLLTTTNLNPPITWTTNGTGALDGAGSFSNTIPFTTTSQEKFFRVRFP